MTHRLFVYGTLAPSRPNEHVLADVPGEWELAAVTDTLLQESWDAAIPDPVVEQFSPVSITFAYISPMLCKWLGRDPNSKSLHQFRPPQGGIGGAADIVIHNHPDPRPVLDWVHDNCVYDRLILYPGSRILCLAWTKLKPRYNCKEWVLVNGAKPKYVTAARTTSQEPIDLSSRLC